MFGLSKLDEQFGDFAFLEDENPEDGSKFAESFIDGLVGDVKGNSVIDADQQNFRRLLLFRRAFFILAAAG